MTRLPRPARWLLRLSPVPSERRAEVQADLHELFVERKTGRGPAHAHWRLYHDLASLWLQPRPAIRAAAPRPALTLLHDARGDLRHAARLFSRQPAILLLTILGLSLGLGVATAAFSIMNAALRGEGLVDPDRAPGMLKTTDRLVSTAWAYDEFLHLRDGSTRMQVEAVLTDATAARTGPADAMAPPVGVAFVSDGFFAATGARMALGRPLEAGDEEHAGPPPVVVSFVFWTSRLHQDPAVVGRPIRIGRTDATIVGVAARGFSVPGNRLLWMPITAYGAVYGGPGMRAPDTGIQLFGRLPPDVALSEAEAQLSGVAAGLSRAPTNASAVRVRLDPHAGLGRESAPDTLAIAAFVFAVIGVVLLLACANVATVLVSAAITREREMGVRAALGASRWRIVRQLVTESLALGTIAAALGLLFAHWAIPGIGTTIETPAGADLAPDLTTYLFLGMVTLVTGVGAGLAPARHGRGADLVAPLKREGSGQHRAAPRRLRSMLVATQAAASVLLIALAALFARATFQAAAIDVGFDAAGLYALSPGPAEARGDEAAAGKIFQSRAIADLRSVPGVAAVSLSELAPFEGSTMTAITRESPSRVVHFNGVGFGYFETLGLRVLAGRTFTRDEAAARAPVAIVSESLARAYWHDQSPLGQVLPQAIPVSSARPVVIGVVGDAIAARLHERNTLAFYQPIDPARARFAQILVRVAPGTAGAVELAVQRLRSIDPAADVRVTSVAALLRQEVGRPRMLATLTGIVGIIAAILCVIGLYGLTAAVVGQRTREMGLRVAMGAAPRDLLRLLMRDSLRPVALGLAAGVGAALLASRAVVAAMFFGISPHDPAALAGAVAILLVAATLAVLVPTRRAAAADAALILRQS